MNFRNLSKQIINKLGDDVFYVKQGAMIKGIFDYEYVEVFEVSSRAPFLSIADEYDVARGDQFDVDGTKFEVTEVEPDGLGVLVLRLNKVK